MKNERKILKYLKKYAEEDESPQRFKDICIKLEIDLSEKTMRIFRHLENQGFILPFRPPNFAGPAIIEREPIAITTNGIIYLEEWLPKKIRFYTPVIISCFALVVAFMAYLKE